MKMPMAHDRIRKSALESSMKLRMGMERFRSMAALSSTVQFPIRSQTTFGGAPYRRLLW
jgi:hypothetical protein